MLTDINSRFLVQVISTNDIIRSKNLKSKLVEMGLSLKISPGVVPSAHEFNSGLLHSAFLSKLICQRKMQLGEVGCALAHRNAITNFLNSDQKFGIMFEDDAEVIANFNFDIITTLLDSNIPMIIALGWIPGFAIAKNPIILSSDDPIELITSPTCTFAYALNRSAAELLVSSHERIIDVADWPIHTLNKVRFYAINSHSPWVTADHDPEFSTIGERAQMIPSSPITVLHSRIRLISALVILLLMSKSKNLNVSPKQIVHRLFIRGLLYKHGVSQLVEKSANDQVIPFPLKFQKMLNFLQGN